MTPPGIDRAATVQAIEAIVDHVCQSAIWHHDRCNWIGAMPEEGLHGAPELTYRSLGADLYGGTAGVALVLAEWAALTGDAAARKTALGACRHALRGAEAAEDALGNGLYAGRLGIAYGLARAGQALAEPVLLQGARTLIAERLPTGDAVAVNPEFDVISGLAGGVIGFLALAELLDQPSYRLPAGQAADRLLAGAQPTDDCLLWPTNLALAEPLLGYSHGASGIATALLEYAQVSGERRYRTAAEQAFAYERRFFDPGVRNWPDRRKAKAGGADSFATFWCHGAPGVALARVRATELAPEAIWQHEAKVALDTTYADLMQAGGRVGVNFSICHGVYGNADVLLQGQHLLPAQAVGRVFDAIDAGVSRYGRQPSTWPCGTNGGSSVGLFLGLAGIGYFLLRLVQPRLPSVLHLLSADLPFIGPLPTGDPREVN